MTAAPCTDAHASGDSIRLPRAGDYMPELDGVRAIAVLLVLAVHCVIVPEHGRLAWMLKHTLSNGWFGVDLFFALSGYLITSILLRTKSQSHYFRNFYTKRILRIFPLYYATLAVLAGFAQWLPFGPFRPAWPYLFYLSNLWLIVTGREWVPLGHTWSLAIEEQFYLVFPFIVLWFSRASLRTLLWTIIALSPLIRLLTSALFFPGAAAFATFCRLDVLAMGALIAVEFEERTHISKRLARRLRVAFAIATIASMVLWLTKQLDFRKLLFSGPGLTVVEFTAALFILVVLTAPPSALLSRVLRQRWMVQLGRISYGIYLIHYPVLKMVQAGFSHESVNGWERTGMIAGLSITSTLALATVSWITFERPILRLKRRFDQPSRSAAGNDGAVRV